MIVSWFNKPLRIQAFSHLSGREMRSKRASPNEKMGRGSDLLYHHDEDHGGDPHQFQDMMNHKIRNKVEMQSVSESSCGGE